MAAKQKSGTRANTPQVVEFGDQVKKDRSEVYEDDIHKMRLRFAYILVGLVSTSNAATLTILFFLGFKIGGFTLDNSVVIAIISATVAELASLFIIILRYLFPRDATKPEES